MYPSTTSVVVAWGVRTATDSPQNGFAESVPINYRKLGEDCSSVAKYLDEAVEVSITNRRGTNCRNGLLANLIGFNVGVEFGQVLVLVVVVFLLNLWRSAPSFEKGAFGANCVLFAAGLLLAGQQIAGYLAS